MADLNELVVLGADADIVAVIETLLFTRHKSIGIKELPRERVELLKDGFHDASPGKCVAQLLQGYSKTHKYALVVRDFEGSGFENKGIPALEKSIKDPLLEKGWSLERIEVIVIEPEIEGWLRFDSDHFQNLIRNERKANADLQSAIYCQELSKIIEAEGGLLDNLKPRRPKEVFESLLARYRIPNSASLFRKLASRESLKGCIVPSFNKFVATMQRWFPNVTMLDYPPSQQPNPNAPST